jgi:glycosyl transferase family 25
MNHIDKIVYINLKHREDRRRDIYEEFEKYDFPRDKIERFEAFSTPGFGILGCGKSHLEVLKLAKVNQWKNVLILEDDFQIVVSKEELNQSFEYFFNNIANQHSWDVLMLAYNITGNNHKTESFQNDQMIGRIRYAQTASAYIVNSNYYDTLIDNLQTGNQLLGSTRRHWDYANDVYWKILQEKDTWLYFKNRLSIQRPSFSDNANQFHQYNV